MVAVGYKIVDVARYAVTVANRIQALHRPPLRVHRGGHLDASADALTAVCRIPA